MKSYKNSIRDKRVRETYNAKTDFMMHVGHEIRTMLTLIKSPMDNIFEKVGELPSIKEDFDTMQRNTNQLIALLTEMFDFKNLQMKVSKNEFVMINITEKLKEFFHFHSALSLKKKLIYSINLPAGNIFAFADEEVLNKILSNLFDNVIKYAVSTVRISLLPVQENDKYFTIEIKIDGILMKEHNKEKIFEPFYLMNRKKGNGLGLALSRYLAELHNGKLYLNDLRDKVHDTFVLRLPLQLSNRTRYKTHIKRL